jgi:hydroxymethylpyrimidine/phosphomethylpyrimidine kinase
MHESSARAIPRVLSIAGSDSGAGAGIQADLKTCAALGVYGLSAITAITAQNTLGVHQVLELPIALVEKQIDAVLEDIGADVLKTGMISSPAMLAAVAGRIRAWDGRVVVDPVMQAKNGVPLLQPAALAILRTTLLPLAEVVTPNLPEAETLLERKISSLEDMREAARALYALGARHVVVKGGHRAAEPVDVYFDGVHTRELYAERIHTRHTHGTGCTFATAIAAFLAHGKPVEQAVADAKAYVTGAIRYAPGLGHGHGPLDHFWQQSRNGELPAELERTT